jgi:hypothetical protein
MIARAPTLAWLLTALTCFLAGMLVVEGRHQSVVLSVAPAAVTETIVTLVVAPTLTVEPTLTPIPMATAPPPRPGEGEGPGGVENVRAGPPTAANRTPSPGP